jgi:hypothetical protein
MYLVILYGCSEKSSALVIAIAYADCHQLVDCWQAWGGVGWGHILYSNAQ